MARRDLEDVAIRLASALGPEECLLVGGLAVGAHGYVRATKDVDFIVNADLEGACNKLRSRGISAKLTAGDRLEGDFSCVRGTVGRIPFDVMPPLVPLDWERSIRMPIRRGMILRVVDLEGLIRLKLRAQGPRDLLDVAALVLLHPEYLNRARELSTVYRITDKLELWLDDARLKAEVEGLRKKPRTPTPRRRKGKPV